MKILTEEKVAERLLKFIKSEVVDKSIELTYQSNLKEVGVDSVAVIELVLFLEREFSICLKEKDMVPENFTSIASLTKCALSEK